MRRLNLFHVPVHLPAKVQNNYKTQGYQSLDEVKALAAEKASLLTNHYGVTSVQYALIDNGEITISGQAGLFSKETKAAPTANSMYGIASVSKVFTTAAVMNLVEDGKVVLDNPVTTYIPDFTMKDSRYKNITVRMLLNHSSGLMGSNYGNALLFGDKDMSTTKNLLKSLKTQRLKAAPGEFSVYCNDGFTLAEILVERVTGMSFSKYIRETFSNPLGLQDTNTPAEKFDESKLARTYLSGSNSALPTDNFNAIGTGGLYSSASDLCNFSKIFMRNANSILENTSLTAMENKEYLNGIWPDDGDSTLGYGLGWDSVNTYPFNQYGIKALSKGGDSVRYHANLTVLPDHNMAIAVLSSDGSSSFNQIMAQEILLAALNAKGIIQEIKENKSFNPQVETSVPNELLAYSGYYNSSNDIYTIKISSDGILYFGSALSNKTLASYTYGGDGKFYYSQPGYSECLSFSKQRNGHTYICSSGYSTLPGIGQTSTILYLGQKILDNPITKTVKDTWKSRGNDVFFQVSEKYSSQFYLMGIPYAYFQMPQGINGYVNNATIINKNLAENRLALPGAYGRDLKDYTFSKKDKIEYLKCSNEVYVSGNSLKALSTKKKNTYLIGKDGYAKYYTIGSKSAGKVVSVSVPKNAAFMVYDKNGAYVNNSYISNKKSVKLPKDGYIAFVGNANSKFTVTYK